MLQQAGGGKWLCGLQPCDTDAEEEQMAAWCCSRGIIGPWCCTCLTANPYGLDALEA